MDRIESMKLYCCIIETGQLSLAADQFNLSKGAVSKQLSKLESYLGGRLINRTTRRLAPTEIGLNYYERAKQIIESVAEAECIVNGLTSEPQGLLKINAPMSFGSHNLGELVAIFQIKYPKVNVNITLSDRKVDLLEEGYDLVIRIAKLEDSSLIARRLALCPIVICASPAYLKENGEPKTPEDLKNHNCLTYAYAHSLKTWSLFNKKGEKKQIAIKGNLEANNGQFLGDAMKHGLGITLIPTFVVEDMIKNHQAKVILPDWQPHSPDISILYPSSKYLSAKVRAFIDTATEFFHPNIS